MADEAKVLILDVISARPAINVKDSRLWSQNSVLPPDPHNLVTERANPDHISLPFQRSTSSIRSWVCIVER
jgi:hypothetical protein